MKYAKIPEITIHRLSVYARHLALLDMNNVKLISSVNLAEACGVNSAQIRKDLAYFGEFGVRGIGYYVKDLLFELRKILGLNKEWRLGLIGVGNLGAALLRHALFNKQGYIFVKAFDQDPEKIGTKIGDLIIDPVEKMEDEIEKIGIDIGVIATQNQTAQECADRLVKAGVQGVLNFAPVQLKAPADVHIENVDFTLRLDALCYKLTTD
ncbi:MAG: redox-sensing transcriptional repressor Rex [Deltaproteobacteria bacterium]|nr:redox-sensing transcriptional repressor Rex [Deltaproteobacteria bacterium]